MIESYESKKNEVKRFYPGGVFISEEQIISHLDKSFSLALENMSKLSDGSFVSSAILNYFGMSGKKTRHLLNNLCAIPGMRYGEVGTYKGSTLFSSMYMNHIDAVCCDNWTQFDGDNASKIFALNLRTFMASSFVKQSVGVFQSDFRDPKTTGAEAWQNIDFFFFDGPHDEESQYEGIMKYSKNLSDFFILMVDDWHWHEPRNGTRRALEDINVKILREIEVNVDPEIQNENGNMINRFQNSDFHNGIAVFACKKNKT